MNNPSSEGRLASCHWRDDQVVVEGRRINPRHVGPLPRFGYDVWDLGCINFTRNTATRAVTLNFALIACPYLRLAAKELIAQRLSFKVVNTRSGDRRLGRIHAKTAHDELQRLRVIMRFLADIGIGRFSDVTQDHLDLFLMQLHYGSLASTDDVSAVPGMDRSPAIVKSSMSPGMRKLYLLTFDRLRDAHSHMSDGGLVFDPWPDLSLSQLAGETLTDENRTARIDERVMGPLAAWCLAYVEVFSADILRAARVYMGWHRKGVHRAVGDHANRKLEEWAARLRERGGSVPATRIRDEICPSVGQIAFEAGVAPSSVTRRRSLITALCRELGTDLNTFGVSPIVPEGAPGPWREPLDARAIPSEIRHLVEACYVVVTFLSGMRDSEAQSLKPGCVRVERDEFGVPMRYKVSGLVFKDAFEAEGDPHEWTVVEQVANALSVMETLCKITLDPVADTLFVDMDRSKCGQSIMDNIGRRLNHFVDYIATELAPRMAGYLPSLKKDADVLDWHIKTSQFRRTIAWYIGAQPFGSTAVQIQFRHSKEILSEGYIGRNTPSGFAAEIERERRLAAEKDVVSLFEESLRGIHQAGPMGREIEAELASVAHLIGDATFRGKVLDTRSRDEKLRHVATRLHPGLLADCVFERSRARCLDHDDARTQPITGICDVECPNALWRGKHLPMLEANLMDVQGMLGRRLNNESKYQKRILRDSQDRLTGMISEVKARRGEEG